MYRINFLNTPNTHEYIEVVKMFLKPSEFEAVCDSSQFSDFTFDYNSIQVHEEGNFKKELAVKNGLKRKIFDVMSKFAGHRPPWGILTGIRPTKLFHEIALRENSSDKAADILKDFYYVHDDKIDILKRIYDVQQPFYDNTNKNHVGIYIGIPFCPTRCLYCSFTSNKVDENEVRRYLDALKKEISFVAERMQEYGIEAESIYIGGGTPTSISPNNMDELLDFINQKIPVCMDYEYTCEAGRPDTFSEEMLRVLRQHGINRISVNPQTMKEDTLLAIGREHTVKDTVNAMFMVRKFDFDSVNMDLIMGLPGETPGDFEDTLKKILLMEPDNITVHSLAMKRSSRLKVQDEEYTYEKGDTVSEMLSISRKLLKQAGYTPYYLYKQKQMSGNLENTGYCRNGKYSCYNIKIMEENQTIIALGAGGISKMYFPDENRLERIPNVTNYEIYIDRIDEMLNRKEKGIFDCMKV